MENEQAKFEGWAIVEMMGHQREIGYVTTEAYGVAVLFRVDVPDLCAITYILKRPEYGAKNTASDEQTYLPAGTKVMRQGTPARSRLVSPAAVYAINPCTEDAAKEMLREHAPRKLIYLELPQKQLALEATPEEAAVQCEICGRPIDTEGNGHADGCPNDQLDENPF